jgi:cell division protein FtsB
VARKIAFMLFLVWSLFLSGLLDRTFSSPGVIQALELRSLLAEKQNQVAGLEAELRQLEEQFQHLEKNDAAIEREIRKTLGYAASDELVFDFGASVRKSRDSVQPEEDAASPRRLGDRGREGRGGQSLGLRPLQDALLPVSGRVERKLRHSL